MVATFENWPWALAPPGCDRTGAPDVRGDSRRARGPAAVTAEISLIEQAIERKPTAFSRPL
jgi:hypothetical protein